MCGNGKVPINEEETKSERVHLEDPVLSKSAHPSLMFSEAASV